MPIPKKIRSRDLPGSHVILHHKIRTGACAAEIPGGTRLLVSDAASGFTLSSLEPCPACGVSLRLDRITRSQVCLTDDPDAPPLESAAFWDSRAEHNDHTWCKCSNCGFTIENYKAVKQGISSDDYIGVNWKFCPGCGKRMAVRNSAGKVVF